MRRKIIHQIENHFFADLNPGYTLKDVYAIRDEWMEKSKQLGWTYEQYDAEILFPVFAGVTTTNPTRFKWVGKFKDFATQGLVLQSFIESGFENKIRLAMNVHITEQWYQPETSYP